LGGNKGCEKQRREGKKRGISGKREWDKRGLMEMEEDGGGEKDSPWAVKGTRVREYAKLPKRRGG